MFRGHQGHYPIMTPASPNPTNLCQRTPCPRDLTPAMVTYLMDTLMMWVENVTRCPVLPPSPFRPLFGNLPPDLNQTLVLVTMGQPMRTAVLPQKNVLIIEMIPASSENGFQKLKVTCVLLPQKVLWIGLTRLWVRGRAPWNTLHH